MSIQCTGVGVSLGKSTALKHVTFSSHKAELIGLIGPNGAGKSTLMRALVGLVRFHGEILIDNLPSYDMSAMELARRVAFLPQERVVHWPLVVRDVVMLGRMPYQTAFGRVSPADEEAVDRAILMMGLGPLVNRTFDQLSGGEQARVLIARLVAQEANTIIADEPVNGLDPAHQIGLMRMLRHLVGQGKTVVVSLHDLSLASQWCERILILNDGVLLDDGLAKDVMTARRMQEVYGVRIKNVESGERSFIVPTELVEGGQHDPIFLQGEEPHGF
ncbi:ABC transporter ATP-binding protein [uncultured Cohaesibacter sp.]|uniref:ABC transporter ATP-binding protein n=1 Tax=uncultured Cohaesibacter sp. TaxID=1002546 RepID=UPI0029C8EC72|nr:ABC transporter ATP-binding protein [uncultured Cohaesibacter sp.]